MEIIEIKVFEITGVGRKLGDAGGFYPQKLYIRAETPKEALTLVLVEWLDPPTVEEI